MGFIVSILEKTFEVYRSEGKRPEAMEITPDLLSALEDELEAEGVLRRGGPYFELKTGYPLSILGVSYRVKATEQPCSFRVAYRRIGRSGVYSDRPRLVGLEWEPWVQVGLPYSPRCYYYDLVNRDPATWRREYLGNWVSDPKGGPPDKLAEPRPKEEAAGKRQLFSWDMGHALDTAGYFIGTPTTQQLIDLANSKPKERDMEIFDTRKLAELNGELSDLEREYDAIGKVLDRWEWPVDNVDHKKAGPGKFQVCVTFLHYGEAHEGRCEFITIDPVLADVVIHARRRELEKVIGAKRREIAEYIQHGDRVNAAAMPEEVKR
jgi:hypothetical protein